MREKPMVSPEQSAKLLVPTSSRSSQPVIRANMRCMCQRLCLSSQSVSSPTALRLFFVEKIGESSDDAPASRPA